MEREKRTLFLVFLTLVVYGLSIFLQEGAFILPFPLFEILFFVVCVQFAFWNRVQTLPAALVTIAGFLLLISVPTIWSFFLDASQMMALDNTVFFDISKILFYLMLLFAGISTAIKQKSLLNWLLTLFFVAFLVSGVIFSNWVIVFAYAFIYVSTLINPVYLPFNYLWLLLFLLEGSYWMITIFSA